MKVCTSRMYPLSALLFLAIAQFGMAQSSTESYKLQVHTTYTGPGPVDQKHKVYVVLWDSPDFVKAEDAMPVSIQPTSSKDGEVSFDVKKTPAYISAVYDASGTWDAQSAPPNGSPLGLYSKSPGVPAPIEMKAGETVKIDVTFDDTVKMKDGKP